MALTFFKFCYVINLIKYLNLSVERKNMTDNPSQTIFVYDGTEYDVSGYSTQHPGGKIFIDNMKAERKDFTEYFK